MVSFQSFIIDSYCLISKIPSIFFRHIGQILNPCEHFTHMKLCLHGSKVPFFGLSQHIMHKSSLSLKPLISSSFGFGVPSVPSGNRWIFDFWMRKIFRTKKTFRSPSLNCIFGCNSLGIWSKNNHVLDHELIFKFFA